MNLTTKHEIPLDDYYFIPAGSLVMFCGYENGFTVIQYNQTKYMVNEQYFEPVAVCNY